MSERIQRQIDRLLDEAETALASNDWATVRARCEAALRLDPANEDARAYLEAAARDTSAPAEHQAPQAPSTQHPTQSSSLEPRPSAPLPHSFASGRYAIRSFLGEGGSKKVYLAHDARLDRDVAVAVVEGLDGDALERVRREARAVARLGDHPNVVAVFDTGDEDGRLYTVYQYMAGGSVLDLLRPDHPSPAAAGEGMGVRALPIVEAVRLATEVCSALAFAHAKGVIHRDLKPANIFLDDAGTAKLGDFGLAAALDRTRLTQHGSFLGTATYMPPEQAMGQPPDPRSDLYSLGCVLYEMLTGTPPFVGEDTVAIVTQHLNTPPVSLRWRRPDIPVALEALVLRLLEKDPAKRPQNADETRTLLVGIDLTQHSGLSTQHSPQSSVLSPQSSSDPLYRQTFVGREAELKQLQSALDGALSGNGGLVMVVGEPGIGKTSICEQLATYAAMRGARSLHGACYEEGSLSLPYLPFVEAMRGYVLDHDADALRSELGSNAPFVARIVSEVRDRLSVDLPAAGDPEDDRWRLLQSVTGFLKNASAVQPLVIVLEDLHWADRGSLDLLTHIARNLQGTRLLVVGTYRDVEVDRSHPLSNALAELRRITNFTRVTLRGLGAPDVRKMLVNLAGRDVPWAVAEQVHRQTEGNPLFVQEVVRWLVEEGMLKRDHDPGASRNDPALAMQIPEGLRDVIGKRLSRLGPECNKVLGVAAVIGRDFRLDVLQDVAALSEDELYAALEEATGKGVLEEQRQSGALGYRFTHAFMRQTLYEEIFTPRRIRTHQQVARAMERRYGTKVAEHAAELAEHYAQSTDPEDLAKAVEYGELAAQRAMEVYAYSEAARHLEAALQAQEVLDSEDLGKRCDLMIALMQALLPAGEQARVLEEIAPSAWKLAEQLGDDARQRAVSLLGMDAAGRRWGAAGYFEDIGATWLDRADCLTAADAPERLVVDLRLALRRGTDDPLARWEGVTDLFERALASGVPEAIYAAAGTGPLNTAAPPSRVGVLRSVLDRVRSVPSAGVSARTLGTFYTTGASSALALGDRAEWERLSGLLRDVASRTMDQYAVDAAGEVSVARDLLDGRLTNVLDAPEPASEFHRNRLEFLATRALVYGGRGAEAAARWFAFDAGRAMPMQMRTLAEAYYHALAGRSVVARGKLDEAIRARRPSEHQTAIMLARMLEVSVILGDAPLEARLIELLEPAADVPALYIFWNAPGRLLGQADEHLGRYEDAKGHYRRALAATRNIRFRPEAAVCAFHLAKLLIERFPDETPEAGTLLDECIPEFRDMGMPVYLEDAMRLRLRLQGIEDADPASSIVALDASVQRERPDVSRVAAPDGTVTLMFTDIEGSTALNVALGDDRWMEVLGEHNRLIRTCIREHHGFEVKTEGDAFMVAFRSARDALRCALAIQKTLATHSVLSPKSSVLSDAAIRVRIGLHTGEPIRQGDDFYGTHVVLAARIAAQAVGGQVLVSSLLRELLAPSGQFAFDEGREMELKGLAGPRRVYAVVP